MSGKKGQLINKNLEEKPLEELSIEELKKKWLDWDNMDVFGSDMIKETKERIDSLKREIKTKKPNKEQMEVMNQLQYILLQTSKNVEVASSMKKTIKDLIQKKIKEEMAISFSKFLKEK